jgi:hypothetical protein
MILEVLFGMVLGGLLGAVCLWSVLGHDRLRLPALSKVLSSSPDGWLIIQQGNRYRLRPVQHDDGAITVDLDGEKHHWEGDDKMHELGGTPLGMAVAGPASVVDVETAAAVKHADIEDDMPELEPGDQLSVGEIREQLQVGQVETEAGIVSLINPFTTVDGKITDLRGIVKGMRHAGTSDLPRKAAENAKLAERASKGADLGQVGYVGSLFAAFLLGAITVEFIAGSGGAGAGVEVPISLMGVLWP